MSRSRRVYHPEAAQGEEIVLSREESHHVARVLRLREGDSVGVFDGRGGEWASSIEAIERGEVRVRVGPSMSDRVEPTLRVVLYQGIGRPDRMDWLVQKTTETGVGSIRFFVAARSEGSVPEERRLERWRRIALEACKQSGRRVVPEIIGVGRLPESTPAGTIACLLDPVEGSTALGTILTRSRPSEFRIAVGPEGGFSPEERAGMSVRGWERAHMGPRVFRTETAGLVACVLALHAWGDLGR